MNIVPRFIIEDDDHSLLGRYTAWMVDVVDHARIDCMRRQEHWKNETAMDSIPEYEDSHEYQMPLLFSKDEFDFAEGRLSAAFSRLTLMRRKILTLLFVEGVSAQDVAERLNCSVKFVYNQKHEALKKLRKQLMEGDGYRGK